MSRAKDLAKKKASHIRRKKRVRRTISGTSELPRVTVFKSNRFIFVQAIDDVTGKTLAALNSKTMGLNVNKDNALKVGEAFSGMLKEKNITAVVFDRNGYLYHGVVATFADALRNNGIKV